MTDAGGGPPGEGEVLAALGRALDEASGSGRPVGVVVIRDARGGDGAARVASAAAQILPPGAFAGRFAEDRVALVLPGFGPAESRDLARRLAQRMAGTRAGAASLAPDGPPRGPAELIAAAEAAADAGRRRVLVVEDEPELATIIDAFLSASGDLEPVIAHSGAEALARCAEAEPALLVVDLELPDMDGAALLRTLRARSPDLPAIACSGKRPERAAGAGFTAFFRKPFDMRELVAEVQRLLAPRLLGDGRESC